MEPREDMDAAQADQRREIEEEVERAWEKLMSGEADESDVKLVLWSGAHKDKKK